MFKINIDFQYQLWVCSHKHGYKLVRIDEMCYYAISYEYH